jgi:predicted nucleic acid-binding protein
MQARESVAVPGRSDRPEVSGQRRIRLFLDSNVITGGIVSPWGMDKAVLSLCAARVCKLVLAEAVRDEVEGNLLIHAERLSPSDADDLIEDYRRLIKLTNPELVPYPDKHSVHSNRQLIRHAADVPVLLSAIASKPDWLLTHNTKHFTRAVAQRTGLRIATPGEFFRTLSSLFR